MDGHYVPIHVNYILVDDVKIRLQVMRKIESSHDFLDES